MFWRPWKPVSDNFQVAIVILSPFVKIQNFPKMRFLRFFWDFLMLVVLVAKKHKNCQKKWIFSKTGSLHPKDIPRYPEWHFMITILNFTWIWKLSKNANFHQKETKCFKWEKMQFFGIFHIHVKFNFAIITCHSGYLGICLGCKEPVFEIFHIFDNFYAFLQPKRPTSKKSQKSQK